MFAESVHRVNTTNKLKQCGSRKALLSLGLRINQLFLKNEDVWLAARFVFCLMKVILKRLQEGEYLS